MFAFSRNFFAKSFSGSDFMPIFAPFKNQLRHDAADSEESAFFVPKSKK